MRCCQAKRLLNRYVDKELRDAKILSLLEQHLKECVSCAKELDSLTLLKGLISNRESIKAGDDFLANLQERLNPESQIVRLRWVIDIGGLAKKFIPVPVAITALVITLLFSMMRNMPVAENEISLGISSIEISSMDMYIDLSAF